MTLSALLNDVVLRPLSDAATTAWLLERRTEFIWRDQFDQRLRPPLFAAAQAVLNRTRPHVDLDLAEEEELPDEARCRREIIEELTGFVRQTWLPGAAQRVGNSKTIGLVRGEFTVAPDLPDHLRHGVLAEPKTFPAWVRFAGPGPYTPPDIEDNGQCSVGVKLMEVAGPKLMDDEQFTQDLILLSAASFITPNVRENAKLQRYVRAKAGIFYFLNPFDQHLLALAMQFLYSRVHSSPLETQYYSTVPFLLGERQAVQYSLKPVSSSRTRIPARPSPNYLREAMAATLAAEDWTFDFMVQVQTDAHRMPIEDATVKWPERRSPYVPVARLRLPAQPFDSDEQLAFADVLRFNPWHCLADHRPLGNQNRARKEVYLQLARLRQGMNQSRHVEPRGDERFEQPRRDHPLRAARSAR